MYYVLALFLFVLFAKGETLEEILSKIDENPYIKSNLSMVESYEGEVIKAKSLPNPEGYLEVGRLVGNNSSATITQFSISQPLKLYGQRVYQTQAALKEKSYQKLQFEALRRQYLATVYSAFYDTLYYKELLNVIERETNLSKEILDFVEKTYKLGESAKLDLFRAQKDYELSLARLKQYQNTYRESLKNLSALVGYQVNDVEGNFFQVRELKDLDVENLPDIKSLEEKVKSLESMEKYYRALAKPQVSLGLITKESSTNKYEAGFMVTFSIPVFYRNLGEIVSVKHQKSSFEYLKDYKINSLKITLSSLKENYNSTLKIISDLDKTLTISSEELKLAEKSYKLKVISLFEFSNVKTQFFEALKYKLELYKNLHQIYTKYIEIGGQI
ncbi:MAG: TolC family protein [Sulfurihydrogenibium sp.]|uniref:TolC family protein n=1 Tax=Sulfurihydrogenibium sp. TaxID=2053621 RepID=UPI003C7C4DC2